MSTRNGDIGAAFAKAWAPSQGGPSPAVLDAAFDEGRWGDVRRIPAPTSNVSDPVNHPAHYAGANGLEVWDVIEAFAADDAHKSHIIKYVLRAGNKGGNYIEDLKKAGAWIDRAIRYHEGQEAA